jgi:hypothetical protein
MSEFLIPGFQLQNPKPVSHYPSLIGLPLMYVLSMDAAGLTLFFQEK